MSREKRGEGREDKDDRERNEQERIDAKREERRLNREQ